MVWFRVDDGFYDHPKMQAIPRTDRVAVAGLWTLTGTYCARHLTDGFITTAVVKQLGGTPRIITHLIAVRLWIPVDDGYQFYDWNTYQDTRAAVEAKRQQWRDRQSKLRKSKDEPP